MTMCVSESTKALFSEFRITNPIEEDVLPPKKFVMFALLPFPIIMKFVPWGCSGKSN